MLNDIVSSGGLQGCLQVGGLFVLANVKSPGGGHAGYLWKQPLHMGQIASADWMDRNMFRRHESCFEIRQKAMKEQIRHDLHLFLADNCQSWALAGDGSYSRIEAGDDERVSAQDVFLEALAGS